MSPPPAPHWSNWFRKSSRFAYTVYSVHNRLNNGVEDPGCLSRIQIFPILDLNFFHPVSRISIKEFKYFNPPKLFLSSRKYDPLCYPGSRSYIFTRPESRIPDPGSRGQKGTGSRIPDPGSGSATLLSKNPGSLE